MGYLGQLQEYKKKLINEESGDAPVKEMAQPHVRAQGYVCPTMFPAEKRAVHQSWQHTFLSHSQGLRVHGIPKHIQLHRFCEYKKHLALEVKSVNPRYMFF